MIIHFTFVSEMVRTYVRKKPPVKYSKETLKTAIEAVKNHEVTLYRASKTYNIPKATLFKHVKGQRGVKSSTMGRPTTIPYEEERNIAESIKLMEKWGFGLSKKELLSLIARYVKEKNIPNSFKNGIPGDDYFTRFKKTFNLSQKKPQVVEVARKRSVDPFIIDDYFTLLKKVVNDIPPASIYNIDETSFCLDPSRIKVVGQRGTAAHRATSGSGKENITVLVGANAAGEKLPPHIVFKGKNVWDTWLAKKCDEYIGITYSATKNGWMEAETFENYFKNNFLKNVPQERPVILIYDGHSSHVGFSLVQIARQENIVILKLPPHTSHILQPMDLSVFRPLKLKWEEELIKWQRKNYGYKLPKSIFASNISIIWKNLDPLIIKNGFQKAGIYPFCNAVIPIEMYEPQAYRRWCNYKENLADRPTSTSTVTDERITAIAPATTTIVEGNPPTPETVRVYDEGNPPAPSTSSELNCEKNPETPSTSSGLNGGKKSPAPTSIVSVSEVSTPSSPKKKTFEEMLLEQIKQTPKNSTKKKRICGGAEVITSDDASAKLEEIEKQRLQKKVTNKRTKAMKTTEDENIINIELETEEEVGGNEKQKTKAKRKRPTVEETSSDDSSIEDLLSHSSDSSLHEVEEMNETSEFIDQLQLDMSKINVGDWVVVKFEQKKQVKMYVGQLTEKEPCLEVKFCRRLGKTSTFNWPHVEDRSIVNEWEIFKHLPSPTIDKRGKIKFNVLFDAYNVG